MSRVRCTYMETVWKQYNKMAVLHFFLINSSLYILFSMVRRGKEKEGERRVKIGKEKEGKRRVMRGKEKEGERRVMRGKEKEGEEG